VQLSFDKSMWPRQSESYTLATIYGYRIMSHTHLAIVYGHTKVSHTDFIEVYGDFQKVQTSLGF